MQEYINKLQEELKFQNYSSKTIKTYISCIKIFIKYIKNDISKISKKTIYEFIFNLQSQDKAPKTINLYKQSIKYFIKNTLNLNINIDIKLSKTPKKLPIILTKNEILKIIKNINNPKHKLIISLSY